MSGSLTRALRIAPDMRDLTLEQTYLLWAQRIHASKNADPVAGWACLLEWARLGGKTQEVGQ